MSISFIGDVTGSGAYPTLNRHIVERLEARGRDVLVNFYGQKKNWPATGIYSSYPPKPRNDFHQQSICIFTWEFFSVPSGMGLPRSFIPPLQTHTKVAAMCDFSATIMRAAGLPDHVVGWNLGVDTNEFRPEGEKADRGQYGIPDDAICILWAGGTDPRHGFDIAVSVLAQLPSNFYMLAKQSIHYPEQPAQHPRLIIVRDDLPSLAPLYRMADLYLHTARAVAPGLTVMEALACGCPVISTDLPPIREIAPAGSRLMRYALRGNVERMHHHIHNDCSPYWYEPSKKDLATEVLSFTPLPQGERVDKGRHWGQRLDWDYAIDDLEDMIDEITG